MVKYFQTLNDAFQFSIRPRNFLPLFVFSVGMAMLQLPFLFGPDIGTIIQGASSKNPEIIPKLQSLIRYSVIVAIATALLSLIGLWIKGAIIYMAGTGKGFKEGMQFSKSRYFSLFSASLLLWIAAFALALVPLIGVLLSIAISLVFFFLLPSIIVGKKNAIDSFRDSAGIFTEKPLPAIAIFLLVGITAFIIMLPFIAFALLVFAPAIFESFAVAGSEAAFYSLLSKSLSSDIPSAVFISLITSVGAAISGTFALKAQTDFYKQLKAGK